MNKPTMNKPWLTGKWNEYRGKVQQQWGKLTDDDLDKVEGQRKELAGKIQQRYGKTREEVEEELEKWEAREGLR